MQRRVGARGIALEGGDACLAWATDLFRCLLQGFFRMSICTCLFVAGDSVGSAKVCHQYGVVIACFAAGEDVLHCCYVLIEWPSIFS